MLQRRYSYRARSMEVRGGHGAVDFVLVHKAICLIECTQLRAMLGYAKASRCNLRRRTSGNQMNESDPAQQSEIGTSRLASSGYIRFSSSPTSLLYCLFKKMGTNTLCGHTSVATSRAQTCSLLKRGAVCVLPMSVPKDFSASKTDRLRCHHLQAGRFTAYYLALSTFSCQKNVRRSCNEPF